MLVLIHYCFAAASLASSTTGSNLSERSSITPQEAIVGLNSVGSFNRDTFRASMDLNDNGNVDAPEKAVADQLFDMIAPKGSSTFSAQDYQKFASDKNNLIAAAQIPQTQHLKSRQASEMVARAAKFELEDLQKRADSKLSTRAHQLDGFFTKITQGAPETDRSELSSFLWATLPAFFLGDYETSTPRLKSHLSHYQNDAPALAVQDMAKCENAQNVLADLFAHHHGPTVKVSVLDDNDQPAQKEVDKARVLTAKNAVNEWFAAKERLENIAASARPDSALKTLHANLPELLSYRAAFSQL